MRWGSVSWVCRGLCGALVATLASGCDAGDVPEPEGDDGPDGGAIAPLTGVPVFDEAPLAIPDDDGSCTAQSHRATSVPIDIALMLDSSGSMLGTTSGGRTKWGAVTAAIASFLTDERTQGVEVGLQYFPLQDGVVGACSTHVECGANGPCSIEICSESFLSCDEDDDCEGDTNQCVPFGQCVADPTNSDPDTNGSSRKGFFCTGNGDADCDGGMCDHVVQGTCTGGNICSGDYYAAPSVPIAPLDQSGPSIIASMTSHQPQGGTPTGPAMAGLLQWATENVRDRPHQTVAVMATDGEPTSCAPLEIPAIGDIAAQGLGASPPVATYIIGVVGNGEANLVSNLHALARAGGTEEALIISSTGDLAQQFLEALYQIRQASLSCAFDLPAASEVRLDYDKVNVEFFTPLSLPSVLYYVGSYENCVMDQGGWFYDVDPETGETPSRIFLCDAVCGQLRAVAQARVDFKVGCDRRDLR